MTSALIVARARVCVCVWMRDQQSLFDGLDDRKNLRLLPNMAFSRALATYYTETDEAAEVGPPANTVRITAPYKTLACHLRMAPEYPGPYGQHGAAARCDRPVPVGAAGPG